MFDWTGEATVREGVRCRTFRPKSEEGLASAVLFDRAETDPDRLSPIILLQHGGSSFKTGLDVWDTAIELAGRNGFRVIALDGPVHGSRAGPVDRGSQAMTGAVARQ